MSHFATPGGSPSRAEDELSRVINTSGATPRGGLRPLGLLLLHASPRLVVVVIAATIGFKADERWI